MKACWNTKKSLKDPVNWSATLYVTSNDCQTNFTFNFELMRLFLTKFSIEVLYSLKYVSTPRKIFLSIQYKSRCSLFSVYWLYHRINCTITDLPLSILSFFIKKCKFYQSIFTIYSLLLRLWRKIFAWLIERQYFRQKKWIFLPSLPQKIIVRLHILKSTLFYVILHMHR